ncbi:MAG: CPBP family intramembrane glutamic endopeptidase [Bacteroidota bacterium]
MDTLEGSKANTFERVLPSITNIHLEFLSMISNHFRYTLELVVLFILLPLIYFVDLIPGLWKFLPITAFFIYCLGLLLINNKLKVSDFKLSGIRSQHWLKVLLFSILIALFLWSTGPEDKLADFSNRKILLAVICYPVFSCLPQEIIFRKFFFWRYQSLFKNTTVMVLINGLLFSFAHLYFENLAALGITFIGGIIFALSYLKSRSLLFITIEHAFYGLILLSSYMNQHFYKAF